MLLVSMTLETNLLGWITVFNNYTKIY